MASLQARRPGEAAGTIGGTPHGDRTGSARARRFGSAKPRGDYSLGAYASGIRDLTLARGHERATILGHSLGGGIALQFAHQFPERLERLILVSGGGFGREVNIMLRAATQC